MPETLVGSLVRLCLKDGGAFLAHGFIEEEAKAFGETRGALSGEKLQKGVEKVRVVRVGHVWILGWMCLATPQHGTTLALPPPPRAALPSGGASLGSLRSPHSAAPGGECAAWTKHFYRTRFTPPN